MIKENLDQALNELEQLNLSLEAKGNLTDEQLSKAQDALDVIDSVYKHVADQHRAIDTDLAHTLNRISRVASDFASLQRSDMQPRDNDLTSKVLSKLNKLETAIAKNDNEFGQNSPHQQNHPAQYGPQTTFEKDYNLGSILMGSAKMAGAVGASIIGAGVGGAKMAGAAGASIIGAGVGGVAAAGKGAFDAFSWARQRWAQNANACNEIIGTHKSGGTVDDASINETFSKHRGNLQPFEATPNSEKAKPKSDNAQANSESSTTLVKPTGSFLDFRKNQEEIQFLKAAETLARNLSEAKYHQGNEPDTTDTHTKLMDSVKTFSMAAEQLNDESKSKLSKVTENLLSDVDKQLELDKESQEKLSESVREAMEKLKSVFLNLLGRGQNNQMDAT
ncbi:MULTISPECIES: hypothetical protein [Pseudoalteromonas]|uniref:hypothetical protein n=1 Tax=Pseudoalteromonas TaxID=53246 RepID=UPI001581BEDD|nr:MULTISPECIES: hypothetical protein [Pseudoalteromonas]MDI4652584.1 hypothetical protein [Pseudoalteromonas shioyasakiensis]NUJ38708.1 hypothetical protein [Pseudoalteromonas sp. 0303]